MQSVPDKQGQFCRISISDNGIGFKEEFREKIFTLFQRLHARDQYEGTGIGLAIAKKIVDKHKGVISAVGRPDEGATFIIILPLRQQVLSSTTQSTLINSQTT
jgi:signal transduction histidine kinase